jgi:hypothetical protein
MTNVALGLRWSICRGWFGLLQCSCRFPSVLGAEVVGAWEGSSRRCFVMRSCLAARSSLVKVGVDMLACPCIVLWPLVISRWDGMPCQAPPYMSCSGKRWHLSNGCEALGLGYLLKCLTILVHVSLSFYMDRIVWRSPCRVYARIPGRVTTSDSDRTNPSTWVYVVRRALAPAAMSPLTR